MTRRGPISPVVYLTVLLLINRPSFPPISGAEDSNAPIAPGEAHRHDAIADPSEAVVAPLGAAMSQVLGDHELGIEKRALRQRERNAVFHTIETVFRAVPFEARLARHSMEDKP